jgi:hypothetical protein
MLSDHQLRILYIASSMALVKGDDGRWRNKRRLAVEPQHVISFDESEVSALVDAGYATRDLDPGGNGYIVTTLVGHEALVEAHMILDAAPSAFSDSH